SAAPAGPRTLALHAALPIYGLPGMSRNACQLCNSMTLFLVDGLLPQLRPEMKERYIRDVKPGLLFIDSVKGLGGESHGHPREWPIGRGHRLTPGTDQLRQPS